MLILFHGSRVIYLTNRKQHVVVGGETSLDITVLSGVPQGSVLGPLLFLVYIDDVSDTLLSDGSVLNLYADDMLLYKPVLLSSELSWSAHIESICTKSRKPIGLLYRRFYGNVDQQSLYSLYSALVRPNLEYAAPVWDPHLAKDITKLENVQRFAVKMCSKQSDLGY